MDRPMITPTLITVLATSMSRRAALVWLYLWARADVNTSITWPSVRTIATDMGMKASNVCEDVSTLEINGWLEANRSAGNKTTYRVLSPKSVYPESGTPPPVECIPNRVQSPPESVSRNGNNCTPKQVQHPNTTKNTTKTKGAGAPVRFVPPTVEEVAAYCTERKNGIDPEAFVAYYEARGWKMAKGVPMQKWHSAITTWVKNKKRFSNGNGHVSKPEKLTFV